MEPKTEFSNHDKFYRNPAWIQLSIGMAMDYGLVLAGKYVSIPVNINGKEAHLPAFTVIGICIFLLLQAIPTLTVFLNRKFLNRDTAIEEPKDAGNGTDPNIKS